MFGKKEMERTCKRCAHKWYLPIKAAQERKPDRLMTAGAHLRATGDRLSPSNKRSGGELQLLNNERKRERVEANSTCPNCGSQSFKQKIVKV